MSHRLPVEDFNQIVEDGTVSGTMVICNDEGVEQNARILRPERSSAATTDEFVCKCGNNCGEYRIFHKQLTLQFFNKAARAHGTCTCDLSWSETGEIKFGLCWIEALECLTCGFKTEGTKLYEEVVIPGQGGRRAAVPNVGLQVGLMHTPVGNTAFRNICATIGIPPPSPHSLQSTANKIGEAVIEVNKDNMATWQEKVLRLNHIKGNKGIALETDAAYNIGFNHASTRTCGQPATQVFSSFVATSIPSKPIVEMYFGNKHCKKAEYLRSKGQTVTCPNHAGVCSQNVHIDDTIGDEYRNVSIGYQRLVDKGIVASTVVTDGDSKACKAVADINTKIGQAPAKQQRDPGHLGKNQIKLFSRQKYSQKMFPGRLAQHRRSELRRFSQSMSMRCKAEIKCAVKKYRKNASKIKKAMALAINAIATCPSGDHKLCDRYSLICSPRRRWDHPVIIRPAISDKALIIDCIKYMLDGDAVEKTNLGFTTQKAESINRSLHRSLPKNTLYMRNALARAHATVHRLNAGFSGALTSQLKAVGSTVTNSKRICSHLKRVEERNAYDSKRQTSPKFKSRRVQLRKQRHESYYNRSDSRVKQLSYAKGLMDPCTMQGVVQSIDKYHSYAKSMSSVTETIQTDHNY